MVYVPQRKMKQLFIFLFCFVFLRIHAGEIRISGTAPAYAGKLIELFEIEDYLSHRERLLASTRVGEDGRFSLITDLSRIQQLVLKSANNSGFLYVQPGQQYTIDFPDRNPHDPYRTTGNLVEIGFFDLDSLDINYKILAFQRWVDDFVGNNFYLKDAKPMTFIENFDRFKANVEKAYKSDTSTFFKTHVRFTIASLDNIQHAAVRNRYEKHDFYLKYTPVQYENDTYMYYLTGFYQNLLPRLASEINEAVYQGILKGSPTLIMNALGGEYTLINLRIRELVMIQALSEVYHSEQYPQTNILTILDSVEAHAMFEANKRIAGNMKYRLTELSRGSKAPDFVLLSEEKTSKTLYDFRGKHLYIHVFDPMSLENRKELELLKNLHQTYGTIVQFVTVYRADRVENGVKPELPWLSFALAEDASFWKNYRIETFPHYVLIDAAGYIVDSPSLGPRPNGQYETIDKTFFELKKVRESMEEK